MRGVPDQDFQIYRDVVSGAYCLQDKMLGKILALAGEDTNVVIVSDHGFYCDHLHSLAKEDGRNHQPFGVAILHGPEIKQGRRLVDCNILDVAPTVLALMGLPVGEDMEGRVWAEAFDGTRGLLSIPSWEQIPGECGMHPRDVPAHDFALDGFGVTGALWGLVEGGMRQRLH
jgi:predicted AlkP superfamily phosphohydrolase/phosphomutase